MTEPLWNPNFMSLRHLIAAACCIFSLGACSDRHADQAASDTNRQVDAAVERAKEVGAQAAHKAAELADTARDKTVDYLKSPEVKQDAAAVKDAFGNAGSALSSTTDDARITVSVSSALAKDDELHGAAIDIQTRAGVVRLAGAAPSPAAKARAAEIARSVPGVATVDNQLEVKTM